MSLGEAAVGLLVAIITATACRAGELTVSVIDPSGHGVNDVVVVVAPAEAAAPRATPTSPAAIMDQRDRAFFPRVLVVRVGTSGEDRAYVLQDPQRNVKRSTTIVQLTKSGTLIMPLGAFVSEARTEMATPVLSKIPYVNRLFRNVGIGRTTSSLMMMVTPRIIIQEEEEQNLLGTSTAANP